MFTDFHACVCTCVHMPRPEVDIRYPPLLFSIYFIFLLDFFYLCVWTFCVHACMYNTTCSIFLRQGFSWIPLTDWLDWLAGKPIPSSLPCLWMLSQAWTTTPSFLCECWGHQALYSLSRPLSCLLFILSLVPMQYPCSYLQCPLMDGIKVKLPIETAWLFPHWCPL